MQFSKKMGYILKINNRFIPNNYILGIHCLKDDQFNDSFVLIFHDLTEY